MKAFWALVAALSVAGAWLVLVTGPDLGRPPHAIDEGSAPSATAMRSDHLPPTRPEEIAPTMPVEAAATATKPRETTDPAKPTELTMDSAATPTTDALSKLLPELDLASGRGAPNAATAPADRNAAIDTSGDRVATDLPARPAPAPLLVDRRAPLEVTRRIDARTIELDGRYRIVGNGRPDDPYRISWELLTSASRYVDPARDALVPPPWVRALDGSYVEISAYYSSAVRVQFARHLLLTLNRWDGCCVGLPPTAFDAIDVSTRETVAMDGIHLVRFGTFRGRLVVEPFHAAGHLLGLYRLEDATFERR